MGAAAGVHAPRPGQKAVVRRDEELAPFLQREDCEGGRLAAAIGHVDQPVVRADQAMHGRELLVGHFGIIRGLLRVIRRLAVRAPVTLVRSGVRVKDDDAAIGVSVRDEQLVGRRVHEYVGRLVHVDCVGVARALAARADLADELLHAGGLGAQEEQLAVLDQDDVDMAVAAFDRVLTLGPAAVDPGLDPFLGVFVFLGLTAYDTQKIKSMYFAVAGSDFAGKAVVMGALTLYLDFINLFLLLLRLSTIRRIRPPRRL